MMNDFDPTHIAIPHGHFIEGRRQAAPAAMDVLRPSDGVAYAPLPAAGEELLDHAVSSSWKAWRGSDWASRAPRDRGRVLRRWADLIEADLPYLAALESLGSTRPIAETASWDVSFTAESVRFYAELADKHGGEVAATKSSSLGMVMAEPYGVIGAITPWNFPLVMAAWKAAPALAAGNAVVLKPSELTPFSTVRLAELAVEAGLPAGLFTIIQGDGATGAHLCRHPRIGKVSFTGSTRTGAAIMTLCAQHGTKPVTLELGGKSPQIVFADVPDLDRTAATIARAITGNAGQVCVAGSRLIAERRIAEPLVDRIAAIFRSLRPGPTWRNATTLAPIISDSQCRRIEQLVTATIAGGATPVTGGGRAPAPQDGAYYLPTLLDGVTADMEGVREEIFGPVLTVQSFDDEEEAFALADHPAYGLAAGLHTADIARALRGARRLEAGSVWINRYGRSNDFILPTGGFKQSGIGKDLGRQAFEACQRQKTVLIDF